MPSRRKRKRKRLNAEATAIEPQKMRGWGRGLPVSGADIKMVRQALREGWPVPQDARVAVVDDLFALLQEEGVSARHLCSVVGVFIEIEEINQEIDLAERAAARRLPSPPVTSNSS
jgi:hypothetical protein